MITKRPLADGNTEVTFHMPASEWITQLSLLGDFNQWNAEAHPMTRNEDGSWTITVALVPGAYRFRYFANGENWANDDTADGLVANEYGSANSLVQIESGGLTPDAKARTEEAGTEGAESAPTAAVESEAPAAVKKTRATTSPSKVARTEGEAPAPKAKRTPAKSRTEGAPTAPKRTTRKKTE